MAYIRNNQYQESKMNQTKLQLSRREFLRQTATGLMIAGCGLRDQVIADKSRQANYPNVIIIMTDDQGYGDLSCHGNPVLKTPRLDELYSQSVRLTDFHVAPVCTPTRGQLMTGMDALRNGARTVPAGYNLIWRDVPTMPEIFRSGGYRTGLFGKWHLGDIYPDRPIDRGFDKAIWFTGWGVPSASEFDNDCVDIRYRDGKEVIQSQRYCTDLWFDEAIAWIKQCKDKHEPFFCYLATNAPHGPYWAKDSDVAPYRNKWPVLGNFFGMIANIDDNMGKLMKYLGDCDLADNTLIVFMTDNGGTAGVKTYNAGFREGKGSYYDGGHRAACFIRWPGGGLGHPRDIDIPTQNQDILPTLIDLCGLHKPSDVQFDGISLAQAIYQSEPKLPDRMMVVQYGGRIRPQKNECCIIWGKWRLVGENELYDIVQDRLQQHNIADKFPDVVNRMRQYYEQWWANIQPRVYKYQPIVVGSVCENPTILNCNMWEGVDVDNSHNIAEAKGGPRGGRYHIMVERAGDYEVELRRWPFHTDSSLGSIGPQKTVSGRDMNLNSRKLPITEGILSILDKELSQKVSENALGIIFRLSLPTGQTSLQGWFRDEGGQDLCGAYYVRFTYCEKKA